MCVCVCVPQLCVPVGLTTSSVTMAAVSLATASVMVCESALTAQTKTTAKTVRVSVHCLICVGTALEGN